METNNSTSESGKSQGNETQQQNQQSKDASPRLMYLEYDRWNKGQHNISAIIKEPGAKRGLVAVRFYTEFTGDPKRAIYTAKDTQGNEIAPPTSNLWELKKTVRQNSKALLEKAKETKQLLKDEGKKFGNKLIEEGQEFGESAKNIALGNGRENELSTIRKGKIEKSNGREL